MGVFLFGVTVVFAAALAPTAKTYLDSNNNGQVDQIKWTFTDVTACAYEAGDWAVSTAGTINVTAITGIANTGTCATDEYILISVTAGAGVTGGATDPAITYTDQGTLSSVAADTNTGSTAALAATDATKPVLTAVALSSSSSKNRVSFTYTEAITVTNGASTTTKGDLTTAGTVAGFGSFATANNVTVPTTKNTVGGNGTTTITIDLADQTAGYMNSTSTVEPSGNVTPLASASVVDAASLQVNTSAAVVLATGGGTWDLTKPTITSGTVSDADVDGKIETIAIVFSSTMKDASYTTADSSLGAGGTVTGTLSGTANDATFNITRTDDATTGTAASDGNFIYSGATTKLTDLAGNLLDTATDGTIVTGDMTEVDNAAPVVVSIATNTASNRNTLVVTYSEAMTFRPSGSGSWYTNTDGTKASTATLGAMTTAGTIVGIGSWAGGTVGNVANAAATNNSLSLDATDKILTITLNGQSGTYFSTTGTAPTATNTFTPVAAANYLKEQATGAQAVATTTVGSAPTITGSWDLIAPGQVSNLMVQGSSTSNVYLVWQPLATLADFSRYVVYRQQSTSSTTFANGTAWTYANDGNLSLIATNTTNVTGLNTGYYYYFVVYAADIAGNMSTVSNEVSVATSSSTTSDTTAPSAPTAVTATVNADGKVVLAWTNPTATDLYSIHILRGKNGIPISGTAYAVALKPLATYTDQDVGPGDTLQYRLRASDTSNNFSSLTSVVSVTVPVPSVETPAEEESGPQDVTTPPSTEEEQQPSVTTPPADEEGIISPAVQAKIERMERLISKYQARYDAYQAKYLKFEDKNAVKYRKYIARYKKRAEKYEKLVEKYTKRLEALQGE